MASQSTGKSEHTQRRLEQVAHHMNASGRPGVVEKHPDDIVVTTSLRTAITKGGRGGFKDTAAFAMMILLCQFVRVMESYSKQLSVTGKSLVTGHQ